MSKIVSKKITIVTAQLGQISVSELEEEMKRRREARSSISRQLKEQLMKKVLNLLWEQRGGEATHKEFNALILQAKTFLQTPVGVTNGAFLKEGYIFKSSLERARSKIFLTKDGVEYAEVDISKKPIIAPPEEKALKVATESKPKSLKDEEMTLFK